VLLLSMTGCATTAVTISRSFMVPVMAPPAAAVAPDQFWSGHVGASTMPFGATSTSAGSGADEVAVVQPDLGMLFRLAEGHFLVGAYGFVSAPDWGTRTKADQIHLNGNVMVGGRLRFGFAWQSEHGVGVMGTVEPGFDVLPFGYGALGTPQYTTFSLPQIGGSVTATYQTQRVRLFGGIGVSTMPIMTSSVTYLSTCVEDCASTGWGMTANVTATTGARLKLSDTVYAALTVTMPINRESIGWTPIFALSLQAETSRPKPSAQEPTPIEDPEEPPPCESPVTEPPLVPVESPQL
jgi:hypothetical protein